MQKPSKRALVTGGAGFLGSHLCAMLLQRGFHVLCLDNFYSGCMSNIEPLVANPSFEVLRQNVMEPLDFEVDVIYNMACPASPIHYQKHPIETMKTCVIGALNMLEAARRRPGTIVIQASTSEVYGTATKHPQREDYHGYVSPTGIRACYDEGKRAAEALCMDYHRQYGVAVKLPRVFNTYGPNMLQNDGRAVSNFIVQALRGEHITIYGDGSQTRSFCYYSDTLDLFLRMMDTPANFTGPINVGNPHEISIGELAETIVRLTGSRSTISKQPLPQDDPTRRCPDITLAKTQLDWAPKVALEDGLKETILYFKRILK